MTAVRSATVRVLDPPAIQYGRTAGREMDLMGFGRETGRSAEIIYKRARRRRR